MSVIRVMGIVIASILGILILQEPITWRYLLGMILTIAGVALIVPRWKHKFGHSSQNALPIG